MNRIRHVVAAAALVFTQTACVSAAATLTEIPKVLVGTWKVTKVYWTHDGPWPDGTPKQWLMGALFLVSQRKIVVRSISCNRGASQIFDDIVSVSLEKTLIEKDVSWEGKAPFEKLEINGSNLKLFKNKRFERYLIKSKNSYTTNGCDNQKYGDLYGFIPFYLIKKNEIVVPNYPLSAAFLVLTRLSAPVS